MHNKDRLFRIPAIAVNIFMMILSLVIFFSSLEIFARYLVRSKQKGFYSRGKNCAVKKHTPLRIVCVGGSTTHGGGDIDYKEAYPFYLEQIINKKSGRDFVEVLNSGLPARPTEYHRDFIRERIGDQELDIIVLHSLYNHFSPIFDGNYNPKVSKIIIEGRRVKPVYNWHKMNLLEMADIFLMDHSYFYTGLKKMVVKIQNKKNPNAIYDKKIRFTYPQKEVIVHNTDTDEDTGKVFTLFISRYYEAIEDIVSIANSRGVETVLVIPPYPFFGDEYTENIGKIRPLHEYNNVFEKARKVLIEIGKKHDLLVVDADSGFLKRGRTQDLFLDSVHLSPKGNYVLADIIASEIMPVLERRYKKRY